jgi:hypothetical protein
MSANAPASRYALKVGAMRADKCEYGRLFEAALLVPGAKVQGGPPIAVGRAIGDSRPMNLYAIRRRDFWGTPEDLQETAARSAEVGEEMADDVRWIRSYVIQEDSGRLGTLCIYEGTSVEKVREQAERTGMPADEITLVADTVIVRPDPVRA